VEPADGGDQWVFPGSTDPRKRRFAASYISRAVRDGRQRGAILPAARKKKQKLAAEWDTCGGGRAGGAWGLARQRSPRSTRRGCTPRPSRRLAPLLAFAGMTVESNLTPSNKRTYILRPHNAPPARGGRSPMTGPRGNSPRNYVRPSRTPGRNHQPADVATARSWGAIVTCFSAGAFPWAFRLTNQVMDQLLTGSLCGFISCAPPLRAFFPTSRRPPRSRNNPSAEQSALAPRLRAEGRPSFRSACVTPTPGLPQALGFASGSAPLQLPLSPPQVWELIPRARVACALIRLGLGLVRLRHNARERNFGIGAARRCREKRELQFFSPPGSPRPPRHAYSAIPVHPRPAKYPVAKDALESIHNSRARRAFGPLRRNFFRCGASSALGSLRME